LEQWFFKTTAYADELLHFEGLRWSERVVAMQRNWIGRSEGADVLFRVEELDIDLPVFTTRPDTLFGATFFVVAPEHPLVERLAQGSPHEEEIREYVRRTAAKTVEEGWKRRRRPVSSRGGSRPTRSTRRGSRSGSPTTSSPTTAPARSWPFRLTTSATSSSPSGSTCR